MSNDTTLMSAPAGSMAWSRVERRIAVLLPSDPDRHFVADALRPMGHVLVEFLHLKDLAQALSKGEEFDLLLVALDGYSDAIFSGSRFLRSLIGEFAALLLIVKPEQLLQNRGIGEQALNDFVLMPCEDCELVARVFRALASQGDGGQSSFVFGRYCFDTMSRSLSVDGKRIRLPPKQFQLALYLFQHANRAHSREELFRVVWGKTYSSNPGRTIDVHIAHLRKLLMEVSCGDVTLMSIRGFGYRFFFKAQRKIKLVS
ncbi:winged helix-turn-helix transcriptional regulator [Variovorax atrisoli]|uniref:winged helix-turn-helix transcriptional regulator n=1 Tax=Variovorax atrisoli TaxID=3394203 RepID=UPI0012FD9057|nr:response regulator transcription factor [Variovorax paradoxus]